MLFAINHLPITQKVGARCARPGRQGATSAFNYAALNKDAQIIHNVHGSLLCVEGVNKELTFIVSNGWPITRPVAPKG